MADTYMWIGATDGDWGTAANWYNITDDSNEVPLVGAKVIIPADASQDITGSVQTGTAIDQLIIEEGCSINIGSRSDSQITALELTFASQTNATVETAGTGTLYLDLTEPKTITINAAGAAPGDGQYACNIVTSSSTNTPDVYMDCESGESVGIAANAGESGVIDAIYLMGGELTVGTVAGVSAATLIRQTGGTLTTDTALGATSLHGGTWRHNSGAVSGATDIREGATAYYNSSGTHSGDVYVEGTLSFDEDLQSKTFSGNVYLHTGGTISDTAGIVTFSSGITLVRCRLDAVTLDVGSNRTLTLS